MLESLWIYKDHILYFKIALVQLRLLNDYAGYEYNIGQMRAIIDMNKLYRK